MRIVILLLLITCFFIPQTMAQDTNEPNGEAASATTIATNTTISGEVSDIADFDWFKIDLSFTGGLQLNITTNATTVAIDVQIYTQAGNQGKSFFGRTLLLNFYISADITKFYVIARPISSQVVSYTIEAISYPEIQETNYNLNSKIDLVYENISSHFFNPTSGAQYYGITMGSDTLTRISLLGLTDSLSVSLYNDSGFLGTFYHHEVYGGIALSIIKYLNAGDYYIKIESNDTSHNFYQVWFSTSNIDLHENPDRVNPIYTKYGTVSSNDSDGYQNILYGASGGSLIVDFETHGDAYVNIYRQGETEILASGTGKLIIPVEETILNIDVISNSTVPSDYNIHSYYVYLDNNEPNGNTKADALPFSPTQPYSFQTIHNESDEDWYTFTMERNGTATIQIEFLEQSIPDFVLYDYQGNAINASKTDTTGMKTISLYLEQGKYYIQVIPVDRIVQTYTLSMNILYDPEPTSEPSFSKPKRDLSGFSYTLFFASVATVVLLRRKIRRN